MPKLRIIVQTQDGSNQFEEDIEFDFDTLRITPNPRQAIVAGTMAAVRKVVAEVDPSFNI